MDNKKNNGSCGTTNESSFHGNQYVDSQGKQKKNSTSNSGGGSQTGGKSTGSSRSGGNQGTSQSKK